MNRRLVSTRGLLYFLMLMFLVFSFGCSHGGDKVVKYTASGTYTYSDGTITMNWTNSDFLCNGPKDGFINTKTGVTVSNTTLTWSDFNDNDIMTWTRESGTAGDPAGTWTTTDLEGNAHVLTIEVTDSTSGTMSWSATIHSCAGDFNPGDSAVCGNATCESGENASNCPNDCAIGLDSLWPRLCAQITNYSGQIMYWKGTWVADHSFGWDEVKVGTSDDSCRHYGGTIFNNVQVKDANGKIYNAEPHAFTDLFNQNRYISYTFTGTKVNYCPQGEDDFPHFCP
jgi:hypothetical protein